VPQAGRNETATVKLRYNVFLGTVKNSTLYQRYIVTTKECSSCFIINENLVNQTPVHYSALLYCFLKKLSKVIWVACSGLFSSNVSASRLRFTFNTHFSTPTKC